MNNYTYTTDRISFVPSVDKRGKKKKNIRKKNHKYS